MVVVRPRVGPTGLTGLTGPIGAQGPIGPVGDPVAFEAALAAEVVARLAAAGLLEGVLADALALRVPVFVQVAEPAIAPPWVWYVVDGAGALLDVQVSS